MSNCCSGVVSVVVGGLTVVVGECIWCIERVNSYKVRVNVIMEFSRGVKLKRSAKWRIYHKIPFRIYVKLPKVSQRIYISLKEV